MRVTCTYIVLLGPGFQRENPPFPLNIPERKGPKIEKIRREEETGNKRKGGRSTNPFFVPPLEPPVLIYISSREKEERKCGELGNNDGNES